MKKYLNDLEAELKKLKLNNEDIQDILRDHEEMLLEASNDGVGEDDLSSKFGDPAQVAQELARDSKRVNYNEKVYGDGEFEGFELIKSFPVLDTLEDVDIKLVDEDLKVYPYEGDSIKVFLQGDVDVEDYTIEFKDNDFTLKNKKSKRKFKVFQNRSVNFGILLPQGQLDKLEVSVVSSDGVLGHLSAKKATIQTTSGDFYLEGLSVENTCKLVAVSGDIKLDLLQAEDCSISLVSGDMEIANLSLLKDLDINTVSGDVSVQDAKMAECSFRTVSGDFEGTEVYPEVVNLKSVSGDFTITNDNKEFEIVIGKKKTLSGDVTIK
jgi:hypothetical protein